MMSTTFMTGIGRELSKFQENCHK